MISLNIEKTLGFISKENVFAYEAHDAARGQGEAHVVQRESAVALAKTAHLY